MKLPLRTLTAPTREARHPAVQQVEIDQLFQGAGELARIIVAERGGRTGGLEPGKEKPGLEESGLPQHRGHEGARMVAQHAEHVAVRRVGPDLAARDQLPELPQPVQPVFRLVAGDDRGVDGADRHPGEPGRLAAGLGERVINPGLIGAQRAAALQHQSDAIVAAGESRGTLTGPRRDLAQTVHERLAPSFRPEDRQNL